MKKPILILLAVLSLFSLKCQAQSFDGGVIAGAVTSQIDGDGYGGFHQIGFTAGVFGRIPMEEGESWQLELKYSLFGSHSDSQYEIPMDIRLHYVELPLMYRFDLSDFNINGKPLDYLSFEIGLSGDFLVGNRQQGGYNDGGYENPNWLFFSVTGNVGAQFDINDHLGINVRYMNSLTPCRLHYDVPLISFRHYYNIALQATVTYTIFHAKKEQK